MRTRIRFVLSTLCLKKQDTKPLTITSPNVNRFSKFFSGRLTGKLATNSYLNIPPHLKLVATLPCEISMFHKIAMLKEYVKQTVMHPNTVSISLVVHSF